MWTDEDIIAANSAIILSALLVPPIGVVLTFGDFSHAYCIHWEVVRYEIAMNYKFLEVRLESVATRSRAFYKLSPVPIIGEKHAAIVQICDVPENCPPIEKWKTVDQWLNDRRRLGNMR